MSSSLILRISQVFFSYAALVLSSHREHSDIAKTQLLISIVTFWKAASIPEISTQVYFLSFLSGISVIAALGIAFAMRSPLQGITLILSL